MCSSHAHAHTKSHPPHVTHLPSTGVITGKLRPFCRPPVLTLVSLSLFNTILVTLYVITTRIILQKHPRKSIHIWYIRLIVIFFLPIPMNAELPSTSLDLAYSCVKCQVLTGRGAPCARPPPSRAHGRDVGETARCAPAVEEETSCCASATSRCAPAVEEESCCTVAKGQVARCAASALLVQWLTESRHNLQPIPADMRYCVLVVRAWTYEYGLNQMYVGGFFTGNRPPGFPPRRGTLPPMYHERGFNSSGG
jgi:hypothetical protein